jgi:hypothetical protein
MRALFTGILTGYVLDKISSGETDVPSLILIAVAIYFNYEFFKGIIKDHKNEETEI